MKKTVRDLEKMSGKGVSYLKAGLYYLFVPTVIGLGLSTVDLSKFFQQGPIWSSPFYQHYTNAQKYNN